MRALLTSWAAAALLTLGYIIGIFAPIPPGVTVFASVLAVVVLGSATVCALRRVRSGTAVTLGILSLCVASGMQRGQFAGQVSRTEIPAAVRAGEVTWVRVVGAARPGPRCRFQAYPIPHGPRLWIAAPIEICPVSHGQSVALLSRTTSLMTPGPGQPDPHAHARARGADLAVEAKTAWVGPQQLPAQQTLAGAYSRWVAQRRAAAWAMTRGDEPKAFVAASILGLPEALRPRTRRDLRRAGLGHLIAVSGLHVGVVAVLVYALFLRLFTAVGLRPSWAPAPALLVVAGFVVLTGAAAPAVRAAVMVLVAAVGVMLGRPVHGPTVLGVAVALMLAVRPAWSVDPGFHLSVVAMAALVARPLRGPVGQTWAVSWAILPVSLLHFGNASPYAVPTNLVVIPLFTLWILPAGALGWMLTPVFGAAALQPASRGASVVLEIAELICRWPSPAPATIAGVAVVLATVRLASPQRWRRFVPHVPLWVAAATVLVVAVPRSQAERMDAEWIAMGLGRRPPVVRILAPGRACLLNPSGPASAWPRRLHAVGVREVSGLGNGPRGPDRLELIDELRAAHMWRERSDTNCRRPPASEVRTARDACAEAFGEYAAVAAGARPAAIRCYWRGQWMTVVPSEVDR